MTKKNLASISFHKRFNSNQERLISTFKSLNKLSMKSNVPIGKSAEVRRINDQIENCQSILKFLKRRKLKLFLLSTKKRKLALDSRLIIPKSNSSSQSIENNIEYANEEEEVVDAISTSPTPQKHPKVETVDYKAIEEQLAVPVKTLESTQSPNSNSNMKITTANSIDVLASTVPFHKMRNPPRVPKEEDKIKKKKKQKRVRKETEEVLPKERKTEGPAEYYEGILGKEYDLNTLVDTKELLSLSKISAVNQLLLIYQLTYQGCNSKLGSSEFWRNVFKIYKKCFNNLSMSSVIRHWYQIRSYGCFNEFIALLFKFKPVLETYDLKLPTLINLLIKTFKQRLWNLEPELERICSNYKYKSHKLNDPHAFHKTKKSTVICIKRERDGDYTHEVSKSEEFDDNQTVDEGVDTCDIPHSEINTVKSETHQYQCHESQENGYSNGSYLLQSSNFNKTTKTENENVAITKAFVEPDNNDYEEQEDDSDSEFILKKRTKNVRRAYNTRKPSNKSEEEKKTEEIKKESIQSLNNRNMRVSTIATSFSIIKNNPPKVEIKSEQFNTSNTSMDIDNSELNELKELDSTHLKMLQNMGIDISTYK